jgi:hypothetical protein
MFLLLSYQCFSLNGFVLLQAPKMSLEDACRALATVEPELTILLLKRISSLVVGNGNLSFVSPLPPPPPNMISRQKFTQHSKSSVLV